MTLSPGDRLDRYEVIELLGAGGMGEVYRARDPKLARDVALKVLRVSSADTNGPARLLREARAVAALSHANVLAVFDVGEVQEPESRRGLAYIAMELVVGRSLRSYLGDGEVPLERRIDWLRDVARALDAAHQAGIIHRDVKAENVMIRFDGVVKVLDFGIARRAALAFDASLSTDGQSLPTADTAQAPATLTTLTRQGTVVGTPFYMAPEQLRGEELDARADQFGWGVLAYWLLTGKPPWRGGADSVSLLSEILSWNPPAPGQMDSRIPARVSNAILRALKKERGARFPSMGALIAALESRDVLAAAPTHTMETVPLLPEPLFARPALARGARGLLVLGAVAACVVGGLAWRARGRQSVSASGGVDAARAVATAGECVSNADCVQAHGGGAWHCHSGRHVCVEIGSPDCKVYAEAHDSEADDVVWIGGMFPLDPALHLVSEMRAAELAREDFAQALAGSGARTGALHARPIGLVVCDEGGNPTRAAHHLADDVEVPAVLGFLRSKSTIASVFLPNHVLSMVSISQAPSVTRIPEPPGEPRLVWRSTLNGDDMAAVLARLIPQVLEPAARRELHGIEDRPYKVAVVWPKDTNRDPIDMFFESLSFNGMSALANGANFRQFAYSKGDAGPDSVVDDLVAFAPTVINFAGHDFYWRVLLPLEARWSGGPRPVYLTESGFDLSPEVAKFVGGDPLRRHRFFSVVNLATRMTNARLVLRYNLAFPSEPIARSNAPEPSYDGFYMLAYAVYSVADGAVSGAALSRAIQRLLPPGPKVDVGPAQIPDAFATLRSAADGHIDLNGALGSLDFDPGTGEAPVDYSVICLGLDDRGAVSEEIDSGLVYDAQTNKIIGTLRCP